MERKTLSDLSKRDHRGPSTYHAYFLNLMNMFNLHNLTCFLHLLPASLWFKPAEPQRNFLFSLDDQTLRKSKYLKAKTLSEGA